MTGFASKRQAAQDKLQGDDAQGYIADYEAALEQPEQEPCIGKDPRCPCQDGDACHYKDCVGTKARPVAQPVAQPEPPPEWEAINNILAEYGLQAISFVAEWKAAQRPWVGLTDDEVAIASAEFDTKLKLAFHAGMYKAQIILRKKNDSTY